MSIDTERLKHDREYWDEVDPTQGHATHYDTKDDDGAPWMMLKDGHWFAYYFARNGSDGSWYGPLDPHTDEWFKQEGWNDCVIRPELTQQKESA